MEEIKDIDISTEEVIHNLKKAKNIPYRHITLNKAITALKNIEKIKEILARPVGTSPEEKAYNFMMQIIDIKEILEEK